MCLEAATLPFAFIAILIVIDRRADAVGNHPNDRPDDVNFARDSRL